MIPARNILLVAMTIATACPVLLGQERSPSDWFLRQVFTLADFNGDRQLSRAEASQLAPQLDYYHGDPGFTDSDLDGDHLLSLEEMNKTAWKAMVHRLEQDEQDLRRLQNEYSYLRNAQVQYLERYPHVARQLLGNVVWTREHVKTVKKLANNRSWLREQPEAADALQNNLIFWMEHPGLADRYYDRPPAGNDGALFEAWRTVHRRYVSQLSDLPDQSQLDFAYFPLPENKPTPVRETISDISPSLQQSPAPIATRNTDPQELDSLKQALSEANQKLARMEQVLEALSQQPAGNAASDEDLERELRMLQVELRLARLEEDSLLATNIRQRRQLANLQNRIVADSLAQSRPARDLRADMAQLRDEADQLKAYISVQSAELDSLNIALKNNQAALAREQARLNQMLQSQASRQQNVSHTFDSLNRVIAVLQDSVQKQKPSRQTFTLADQRQLTIDSLRLALVQSGLRRQSMADSLLYLNRLARRRADSVSYWYQVAINSGASAMEDSLFEALEEAEAARFAADQQWRSRLDSMSNLLSQARVAPVGDMASRAAAPIEESESLSRMRTAYNAMTYDNDKLRQQLEAVTRLGREQETILREQLSAVLKNNRRLEYQNRKLRNRVSTRRLPASTVAIARMDEANFELTEARTRIQELESINQTLLIQLQTSQAYILQRMREEQSTNQRLSQEILKSTSARYQADTLSVALANALRNSWPDTVALLRQEIRQLQHQQKELEKKAIQERVFYYQQRDSLVQVIDDRDLELIRRNRQDNLDNDRFTRVEAKERRLEELRLQLESRQRILDQRDQVIQEKLAELAQQEQKYLQLEAWENELKRREQLLKNRE